jgi:hypothetical protein
MSIAGQAADPASPLCRFLDAWLPDRHLVSEDWSLRSAPAPWSGIAVDVDRRKLGLAVEVRVGLDLAGSPGYWELLSFLPPRDCDSLLRGAGYSQDGYEHLADTGTSDPLLLEWARNSSPIAMSVTQQATLQACWDAVQLHDLVDALSGHSAQLHRSFLARIRGERGRGDRAGNRPDPAIEALTHLWEGYLQHGRRQLTGLGKRIVLAPELAAGFGIADLIAGRCLVEIKTVLEPGQWLGRWLNQLLGYVLLDWFDSFRLDTVAVYLGWQAQLMATSIPDLLTASSPGPTPELEVLRAEFRQAIHSDLDFTLEAKLRKRYPPPLAPPQPGTSNPE